MGKTVEEICNVLISKHSKNFEVDFSLAEKTQKKTLTSCVCCSNPIKNNPYQAFFDDENLYNNLERKITTELAQAIDDNSVEKIKYLKNKYGDKKEFKSAKEFLNKKCKEIWNVYEKTNRIPKEAMKCLGITNQPDLDFILGNSLKYYEKDNSDTTSYIISSTLKNENLSYTIQDIHNYLKEMNKKAVCKYNFKTVKYLIAEQNYTKEQLLDLGIEKETIKTALKSLGLKYKLKYLF